MPWVPAPFFGGDKETVARMTSTAIRGYKDHGVIVTARHFPGFGLQNIHGIPKPTYRVFEILHSLGNERLKVTGGADSTVEILAVRGGANLTLLVYNHNIPGADIRAEEVIITLKRPVPSEPVSIAGIDSHTVNPKQKWIDLGSPEYPDSKELAQIAQASLILPDTHNLEANSEGYAFRLNIPAHRIAAITLKL